MEGTRIELDLTQVGMIPDGDHVVLVQKLERQVKVGDKWNKDGTKTVPPEEFAVAERDCKRLHFTLMITGKGSIWHDLYLGEKSLPFLKNFMKATGVNITKDGFDPDEAVGKQVGINVATKEDPTYGAQTQITKVWKV